MKEMWIILTFLYLNFHGSDAHQVIEVLQQISLDDFGQSCVLSIIEKGLKVEWHDYVTIRQGESPLDDSRPHLGYHIMYADKARIDSIESLIYNINLNKLR